MLVRGMLLLLLVTGCDKLDHTLLTEPKIEQIGTFDGCDVVFVDRGYDKASFFMAKCGNTSTITNNQTLFSDTSQFSKRSTVITQTIEKLQKEKAEALAREAVLSKLSDAEKAAIGIKPTVEQKK
jgi:hypothetical protein